MSLTYNVPDWFQRELHDQFDGRLRIRWSSQRNEYHIENKMGRGALPRSFISVEDDAAIRLRDGYDLVMRIRTGDRMPCPGCGAELRVPFRETAEVKCETCHTRGKDGRYKAAFYPLDETLLQHLRYTDPYRGGTERQIADMDREMALNQLRETGFNRREANAGAMDDFIGALPTWRYAGMKPFGG